MNDTILLSNGYTMPTIGLGTYGLTLDTVEQVIHNALDLGYRHIETAPIYQNERAIGDAIRSSTIDPDAVFLTSKIPPHIKTYDGTIRVAKRSMEQLGVDRLDALLINNPVPWGKEGEDFTKENLEVWRALEDLYDEEYVGSIGLSNFDIPDLEALLPHVRIKPHINQLGVFVGHPLTELVAYCHAHDIVVQGHSPLARGRIFRLDALHRLAKDYDMTPAQIALRYVMHLGVHPIVKATSLTHLKDNLALDRDLPEGWHTELNAIKTDVRDYRPPKATWIL
jgi:diketogulonate reductase-like aldo/keto reductase